MPIFNFRIEIEMSPFHPPKEAVAQALPLAPRSMSGEGRGEGA